MECSQSIYTCIWEFDRGFIAFGIEILMIFELVITEALGFWTNHFALGSFGVVPAQVKAIFAFF